MIELLHKKDCCGCSACVQLCPKHCISMSEDEEGFLYPKFDSDLCIDCHLCEKVCPVINQNASSTPLNVFATQNPNDTIRMQSSSGGVFTMLAESIIDQGGVVFGAKFNEHWAVIHSYTETKEGLSAFRMSKYFQSIIGNTFKEAEMFLRSGRKVLFSGTPCQIVGLKHYLRKEYTNLYTVDFICHGVPSPGVFRWYIGEELQDIASKNNKNYKFVYQAIPDIPEIDVLSANAGFEIKSIKFRDKKLGWKKFSFSLELSELLCNGDKNIITISSPLDKNPFLKGFLKDLYLRPSCHSCPARNSKSGSDLTIGDFWGMGQYPNQNDDDRGTSIILLNSKKGTSILESLDLALHQIEYNYVCKTNSALVNNSPYTSKRKSFFTNDGISFMCKINTLCRVSFYELLTSKLKNSLKKISKLMIKSRI